MNDKLDQIIKLLVQINEKLSISPSAAVGPVKPKKLTEKQKIHMLAVEGMARQKILDQKRAKKKFAPEHAEIEKLEKKLKDLKG